MEPPNSHVPWGVVNFSGSKVVLATALVLGLAASSSVSVSGSTAHVTSCTNASVLATWSTVNLIKETIVVPFDALDTSAASLAAKAGYGGIILFGTRGPSNLKSILARLRHDEPRHSGLLVMTDDEGGGVWRLANLITPLPWARQLSLKTPAEITAMAKTAGQSMLALGINMDLAPVADIDGTNVYPGPMNADGLRSFSGQSSVVSTDAVAFMKGLTAAHVVAVVKHFPGLGGVRPNTDTGAASTASWSVVKQRALGPFRAAIQAGAPAIMVSNATIPGLSALPASLSKAVMSYLRTTLNFKGLIIDDSLSAGAISDAHYGVVAASVAALGAGADVILYSIPSTETAFQLAQQITSSVSVAVAHNKVTRAQLLAAATLVIKAQGANLCV